MQLLELAVAQRQSRMSALKRKADAKMRAILRNIQAHRLKLAAQQEKVTQARQDASRSKSA